MNVFIYRICWPAIFFLHLVTFQGVNFLFRSYGYESMSTLESSYFDVRYQFTYIFL